MIDLIEAMEIIKERNGEPKQNDWELAEASMVILHTVENLLRNFELIETGVRNVCNHIDDVASDHI